MLNWKESEEDLQVVAFFLKGSALASHNVQWLSLNFVLNKRQFWHNCSTGVWGMKIFIKISFILELCLYTFGFLLFSHCAPMEFILLYFSHLVGIFHSFIRVQWLFGLLPRNYNNEKSCWHIFKEIFFYYCGEYAIM